MRWPVAIAGALLVASVCGTASATSIPGPNGKIVFASGRGGAAGNDNEARLYVAEYPGGTPLSRDAAVSFALARQVAGRRVKGSCVKPTRANRRKKACRHYTPFKATFGTAPGTAGANSLPLPKHNGRRLPRGSYRLTIRAALPDGTKVNATALFRVT